MRGLRDSIAKGEGFSNAAHWRDMTEPHVSQLLTFASEVASQAAAKGALLVPCLGRKPVTGPCVRELLAGFGGRAFRRPLDAAEADDFARFFEAEAAGHGPDVALQQVLRAIFLSPAFLYRSELGAPSAAGAFTLTMHERAAALSYFLTDGPPDAELADAANEGALATATQIEAHARRLIATPEIAAGLRLMLDELFRVADVLDHPKDTKAFPGWSIGVVGDVLAETRAFIDHVVWKEGGTIAALLTAPSSFLNARLASAYGIPGVTGDRLRQVTLPAGRMGLLMQGSFLASAASMTDTEPVKRGVRIRRDWLCQAIPPPPPDAGALPPQSSVKLTHRERLARHSMDPKCSGCRRLFDDAGLAFETFDARGRARTTEHGKAIDTRGRIPAPAGELAFASAAELVKALAASPDVMDCAAGRVFAYGMGRPDAATDACVMQTLKAGMRASGGDLRQAVLALVTSDAFFTRTR